MSYKEEKAAKKALRQAPGPDAHQAIPAKKDKKRWCGGHEGREHTPVCMKDLAWDGWAARFKKPNTHRLLSCTTCGKVLERYYGTGSLWAGHTPKPKPDWVTF